MIILLQIHLFIASIEYIFAVSFKPIITPQFNFGLKDKDNDNKL